MASTAQIEQLIKNIERADAGIEDVKEDIQALDIADQDTVQLKSNLESLIVERNKWQKAVEFLVQRHEERHTSEHESEKSEE